MAKTPRNKNLKPFTSENQPPGHLKSRKGIPNRATVLKKWLTVPVEITNPVSKKKEKATVEDEVILALITEGRRGNVHAIREILDSVYGKQSNVNFNLSPDELAALSDEELDALIGKLG